MLLLQIKDDSKEEPTLYSHHLAMVKRFKTLQEFDLRHEVVTEEFIRSRIQLLGQRERLISNRPRPIKVSPSPPRYIREHLLKLLASLTIFPQRCPPPK